MHLNLITLFFKEAPVFEALSLLFNTATPVSFSFIYLCDKFRFTEIKSREMKGDRR